MSLPVKRYTNGKTNAMKKITENTRDSIHKSFLFQTVYQLTLILAPLIVSPYISRVLGAGGIGQYSYTNTIVILFIMVANLGIANHGSRKIASLVNDKIKQSRAFWSIFICHGIMTSAVITVYFIFVIGIDSDYTILLFCQSLHLFAALFDITWLFAGLQKFKVTAIRSITIRCIIVTLTFLIIKTGDDVWKYILLMSAGTLAGQLVVWSQIKKYILFVRVTLTDIMQQLKPMLLLFIPVAAVSIYRYTGKVLLPNLSTIEQLGLYENAEKITTIPLGLIMTLGIVMLPKASSLIAENKSRENTQLLGYSMKIGLFLAIGMMFGLIGIAPTFAPVFFGEEFTASAPLICFLSISMLFMVWANQICQQYLIPHNREKDFIISVSAGAAVNVILNLILIPKLGAMGAVIGTVAAEGTVAVFHTYHVRENIPVIKYIKENAFFLIPGIVMMIIVRLIAYSMDMSVLSLCIQFAAGGGIYLTAGILFMYFTNDDVFAITVKKLRNGLIMK